MERAGEIDAALSGAECVATAEQVQRALDQMAASILALEPGPAVLLCVMNGGLMVAAELLKRLPQPLRLDYVHATRYREGTRGGDIHWRAVPRENLAGAAVIVVDDIYDEGHTLAAIADDCRARGASRVISAVLVDKQHGRKASAPAPEVVGLRLPDRYLVGFGMDYQGYLRNNSAIYALAPEALLTPGPSGVSLRRPPGRAR